MNWALRAVSLALLIVSGCGRQDAVGPSSGPIAIGDLCDTFIEAACDRGARCGTAPADRATCRAQLTGMFDECPFWPQAVAMGEATYDAAAARLLVEEMRAGGCADPLPDPIALTVFVPARAVGESCHSKVSCKMNLTCDGHTVSTPAGVCTAP